MIDPDDDPPTYLLDDQSPEFIDAWADASKADRAFAKSLQCIKVAAGADIDRLVAWSALHALSCSMYAYSRLNSTQGREAAEQIAGILAVIGGQGGIQATLVAMQERIDELTQRVAALEAGE